MRFDRRMMCRSTTHILCVGTIVKPSSTTLITLQANLNSRYFFSPLFLLLLLFLLELGEEANHLAEVE